MKIAYIPAVSDVATIEVIGAITQALASIICITMNVAWALIFIKLIVSLIKAIRTKSVDYFIKSLGACFLGGLILLFAKYFHPVCDAFFDRLSDNLMIGMRLVK